MMSNKVSDDEMSAPVDLSPNVYAAGGDHQLLCCQVQHGMWISAAELIYEFTGEPGQVVRNSIMFPIEDNQKVEVNLLDGVFKITGEGKLAGVTGRKGVDLLMKWKDMSLKEALGFIAEKYSEDHAKLMGADYEKMKVLERAKERSPMAKA